MQEKTVMNSQIVDKISELEEYNEELDILKSQLIEKGKWFYQ
mgnify:CR=1 FL=1